MTQFLIDATKATDVAFLCTSAWEGGFFVGAAAGASACLFISLVVRIVRGRV